MRLSQIARNVSKEAAITSARATLNMMPVIGTAIDEVLFGISERIKSSRLEQALVDLTERMEAIKDDTIVSKEYLSSEDFYDLTVNIFKSIVQTQSQEKYRILSSIYIDAIRKEAKWNNDLCEILIRVSDELTKNHIVVLQFMVSNIESFKRIESYERMYEMFSGTGFREIDKDIFRMCLKDFDKLSLINFSTEIKDYTDATSVGFNDSTLYGIGEKVILTTLGRAFVKHLQ